MIVLEQGLNGYDEGLQGLRIGSFIKRNLKSAVKDVGNVAKVVAPLALSLIPVAGGAIGGVVGKILTNSDGSANLVGRIADSVQNVAQTNVGQSIVKLATPLVKNATANLLAEKGQLPSDEQLQTLADQKGTTPQQELDAITAAAAPVITAAAAPVITAAAVTPPVAPVVKDNTMLYVGGGLVLAGLAYVALK